jgi:predicted transcriptional regulator of viral defense system
MNTHVTENKYRKGLSAMESRVLSDLAFRGKTFVTPADLRAYDLDAGRFLHRLEKKGWVAWVKRNLYMIAPLDAGPEGARAYTVHSLVLASHLVSPSYIGFWSALNYHGMTDATPPAVFVATTVSRGRRTVFDIPVIFVTLRPWKMFGTTRARIGGEDVSLSDPEKTVVDCLDHPEHAGGIPLVAAALREAWSSLDFPRVLRYARRMRNSTVLKRLGYLLEASGRVAEAARVGSGPLREGYSKLDPKFPPTGRISERWKLRINVKPEILEE